ncbi:MAG: fucose isomerase [Armatimonadota bacterium]
MLGNAPEVKLAIVGVSRDCFPIELTRTRLGKLSDALTKIGVRAYICSTMIENENDTMAALAEVYEYGANAAVIYLGNFGPEAPLSIFAEQFNGPVMTCAAAEESKNMLIDGRGDAFCGMLNASYSFGMRHLPVHIPKMPVGLADDLAPKIKHFVTVARVVLGVLGLKIFGFGPRPQDFFACNAPIKPLYDLGVEVMENSELDLLQFYNQIPDTDPEIMPIAEDMAGELGQGNTYPDLLPKIAKFELALMKFYQDNLGSREFGVFANKCWPAFENAFGFVPCYVNSRLSARGIPVACEVDLYGALSEYMCYLASESPATLLDINNTVPRDMIQGTDLMGALAEDLFMGFHCGNTPSCQMQSCFMKYQLIMNRLIEPDAPSPDVTRGTLEGRIKPGPTTLFRLQGTAECSLESYVCEGNVLDIDPMSFGSIGVFAIPDFARFYRHVLITKHFPHHGAVAFAHCAGALFDALKLLGVEDINTPLPKMMMYHGENPFDAA